ncbi:MAG: DNA mismatch repair endonuclease MutL [Muribaculaceae bacterium]|nr:DNA mismatch repair endonuclease MutL [Muribaculaceae bacterium]
MSDVIRLLPDSVANQIAAGEVIQRPASVIKELIENSVDAGATEIQVIIRDAGRTLIQVIDNGKGMTETDARMAFERHATSKIQCADDLFSLATMGFRGEALPSICAVSQVELRTRTKDESIGTRLIINGSQVESHEACVCDAGANFMVKNLFYNVPARRKFLKSDSVELANIMREFERLALVNHNIRLSIDTGGRKISLQPGNFKQRISEIWKNSLNLQLLPIEVDTSLVKISGFISRPEFSRKRNPLQYLIVNGRNMKHPYFHKAIVNCYENLTAPGTQPCYFLRFTVDPGTIDVNIHPTKNEIKFENEKEIWPILSGAVRAALGKFSAVPSIDFNEESIPVLSLTPGVIPEQPKLDLPAGYNPFEEEKKDCVDSPFFAERQNGAEVVNKSRNSVSSAYRPSHTSRNWESLYDGFMKQNETLPDRDKGDMASLPEMPEERPSLCIQFALKYIVSTSREGLLIIDQHRAHVKILYEQFIASSSNKSHPTQRVIFPDVIHLDPAQQLAMEGVEDELKRLGFTLKDEGDLNWSIEGVPPELSKSNPTDIIMRIIESVSDDNMNYGNEQNPEAALRGRIALIMARCGAICRGDRLTDTEMEHIITQLFSLPDPAYTPYGKPVYKIIPESRLQSLF